jgi:hypothetical protein
VICSAPESGIQKGAWTRSEAFRAAHREAGEGRSLTILHPEFEGFEVIQIIAPSAAGVAMSNAPSPGGSPRQE